MTDLEDLRKVDSRLGPLRKWNKKQLEKLKSTPSILHSYSGIGTENIENLADIGSKLNQIFDKVQGTECDCYHHPYKTKEIYEENMERRKQREQREATSVLYPNKAPITYIEERNYGMPPPAEFVLPSKVHKSNDISKNFERFAETLQPGKSITTKDLNIGYTRYREESLGNGKKRIYSSIRL